MQKIGVQETRELKPSWRGEARLFSLIFFPVALALALVLWGFCNLENLNWRNSLKIHEQQRLNLEKNLISSEFRSVVSDILYLSGQALTKDFLDDPNACDLKSLQEDIYLFSHEKGVYDQVRVLDTAGQERVRVNYMAGRPRVVSEAELQNKSNRYYFEEALILSVGQIYVSPFDLNIEHGQLEIPYKPTIRFATPLFDRKGEKSGVMVFNYLGGRMINLLKRVHSLALGYAMLLNQDGYWLFGDGKEQPEWGFMFEKGKDWSLKKMHPQAWQQITNQESGQFFCSMGLITFDTVIPTLEAHKAITWPEGSDGAIGRTREYPEHWKLVSVVPQPVLDEARSDLRLIFLYVYLLLLVILAVGSGFVSRIYENRRATRQALLQANENLNVSVRSLTKRNRQVLLVNRMGDLLQSCDTVQETYEIISHYGQELFPDDAGQVCLADPESRILGSVAAWGSLESEQEPFPEEDCWALRRGKPHLVEKPDKGPICPHFREALKGGTLCLPMMAHGTIMGLMSLALDPALIHRPEADMEGALASRQRLAVTVADLIALSVSNIMLRETLREQSIRDALTGLYNRRHMEDSLDREVSRAQRRKEPVSLIMLDVDHFKGFNDNYGHDVGDKLLSALGKLLMEHSRAEDIACRYGGEEFLLILPGASREIAAQRAEHLRSDVERKLKVRDNSGKTIGATISAGVSSYPQDGDTPETAVEAADMALYRAKEGGRNRVETARSPQDDEDGAVPNDQPEAE